MSALTQLRRTGAEGKRAPRRTIGRTNAECRMKLQFPATLWHCGFLLAWPPMATHLDPDAALMLRVKRGDRRAFEELVDKYKRPVTNAIYRTLGDMTEAEDLAQNVFVQVYKSAHRYEVSAKFSTWLFTIARNLCLNEIRRRSRHPAESLDQVSPDNDEQPLRQVEDLRNASPPDALL